MLLMEKMLLLLWADAAEGLPFRVEADILLLLLFVVFR